MNDKIKEILDFKENADYKKLSCDEIAILRDYITNLQHTEDLYNQLLKDYDELQQENERLKEKNKMLQEDAWRNNANLIEMVKEELEKTDCEECEICEDYKSRIEKAVEILKNWHQEYNGLMKTNNIYISEDKPNLFDLKDVLNGRSDE